MSSSHRAVYSHPPPTTNVLNSQQRARLIHSTRKLGAVLGTTPCLLENDTSYKILPLGKATARTLKRQGSIFTHHQASSLSIASTSTSTTSSHHPSPSASSITLARSVYTGVQCTESLPANPPGLSTTRKHRLGDKLPQLYLQLNTVPVSSTDDRLASLLSPGTPIPPTPITPPVPDVAETRRKRMAKLTRHLGENIPVELISVELAPKPDAIPASYPARKPSQSVHLVPAEVPSARNNRPPHGRQEWVGEWNRSNIRDVQKELRNLKLG